MALKVNSSFFDVPDYQCQEKQLHNYPTFLDMSSQFQWVITRLFNVTSQVNFLPLQNMMKIKRTFKIKMSDTLQDNADKQKGGFLFVISLNGNVMQVIRVKTGLI